MRPPREVYYPDRDVDRDVCMKASPNERGNIGVDYGYNRLSALYGLQG